MESPDRVDGAEYTTTFTKRKRTKRLRTLSSPPREEEYSSSTMTTTTAEEDEEEYMAHCLILLACGRGCDNEFDGKESAETKGGFYTYQCKTCDKCFPSFQALGGHRASHKKPRLAGPEAGPWAADHAGTREHIGPAGKPRVHECSICGAEFASGQALGGHMRRHRPIGPPAVGPASESPKEERNLLPLDLNLPAPSEFALALVDCRN